MVVKMRYIVDRIEKDKVIYYVGGEKKKGDTIRTSDFVVYKVVEISGFRGTIVMIYGAICLFGGFVLFPAWALMSLWNLFSIYVYRLPHMTIVHGFMLYALFVLLYIATSSDKTFGITSTKLSKSHITALLNDIDEEK